MMSIEFYGKSDVGRIRTNNEDAYIAQHLWNDHNVLAVAIDGLGGYEGGEVAAQMARQHIVDYLSAFSNGERELLLKQAVVDTNNAICTARANDTERSQMGCVLSAGIFDAEKKRIYMAHMGDTRFYQFWNGRLVKLSHDHSLVGYREEIGDLSEAEAMAHPQRNVISRIVGHQHLEAGTEQIECGTFEMLPGAVYLLCSDGLTDMVSAAQITEILNKKLTLEELATALIDSANIEGGKDNITVVLVRTPENTEDRQETTSATRRTSGKNKHPRADINTKTGVAAHDSQQFTIAVDDAASGEEHGAGNAKLSRMAEVGMYLVVVASLSTAAFSGYRAHNLQQQNAVLAQKCDSLAAIVRSAMADTTQTVAIDSLSATPLPESADTAAAVTPSSVQKTVGAAISNSE